MLSGRGLCDELITRPEESYRLWCVVVYDLETSRISAPYIYEISSLMVKVLSNLPNFCGIYGELCIVNQRSFHLPSVDTCAFRVGSLLRCKVAGK